MSDTESFTSSTSVPRPDPEGAVGLLDPRHSQKRRQMLGLIDRLRGTGAQLDLDLPVIAVLGSQSAGKSSLIESISGIKLPRASGTCTRCPTECLLTRASGPWRCAVSLRLVTDARGAPLTQPHTVGFGDPIFDKGDVAERIRRAQLAILSPGIDCDRFIDSALDDAAEPELSFSSNSVCLHIYGQEVDDLSFVDLPGLIVGGNTIDRELVQKLAEKYIEKSSCIILLTIACETDFENQIAHKLAEEFDPQGSRTIGVLTKPDRIDPGEEDQWIRFLNPENSDRPLDFYCVKNPASQALKDGITWEQARRAEHEFFSQTAPWATLDWLYTQRLGTEKLTQRLARTLTDLITRRLPELQNELEKLLAATESSILRLPPPPSDDPVAEVLRFIGAFTLAVERLSEGIPGDDGLFQTLHLAQAAFQKSIRLSAPDFRPFERAIARSVSPVLPYQPDPAEVPPPHFLTNEEDEKTYPLQDDSKAIFIDDIMSRANDAVTRELPNNYPFIVKKQLIVGFVDKWDIPAKTLFLKSRQVLQMQVLAIVNERFEQFGFLRQRIAAIVSEHIRVRVLETEKRLDDLQNMEKEPFTRNGHYFADYRSKFLAHYKALRRKESHAFIKDLEDENKGNDEFNKLLNTAMSSIQSLGFRNFTANDIPRLLPPDPMESAIEIMADVRAYFQVAYKRFVDIVPMTIDLVLIKGVTVDLQKILLVGLGVKGPGGFERCHQLLEEPEGVSARRKELVKRRERLARAREELVDVFV
ncbi:P-loop containing nucleoside triphosphate hydrolase protein [Vararia minispora EC-137]|uniref:P-loop containing nucleoside triphosphate hydrolase protein n=1 Tax=Vararia minispora EC-137 TaxID=1314806 RepID=A0ACB8QM91_9AGAM|nr:P-loop containing nucleoside triphosphate hydrolase protein [Vararia minispora EC-137]